MAEVAVALYGAVLLLCSVSFMLLSWRLDVEAEAGRVHSWGSGKNRLSILLYALAIGLSLWSPPLGAGTHVRLALLWLMPEASRPGGRRAA